MRSCRHAVTIWAQVVVRNRHSSLETVKRVLVKLMKSVAAKYNLQLTVNMESSDKNVSIPFKKVSLKVHPDKCGAQDAFQNLIATNDLWQELLKNSGVARQPSQPESQEKVRRRSPKPCFGRTKAFQTS